MAELDQQDGRLAPASFSFNYKIFDQLLKTVKKLEKCFESICQMFSTNINFTTDFQNSCQYRLIRAPKQSTQPELFL